MVWRHEMGLVKTMRNLGMLSCLAMLVTLVGCGPAGGEGLAGATPTSVLPPTEAVAPTVAAAEPEATATPLPATATPLPAATATASRPPMTATAEPTATATPASAAAGNGVLWRVGGAVGSDDNPFTTPGGLATDGERVYVADAYQGALTYDLAGAYQGLIGPGEVGYIADVAVGPDGTVYLADTALHQITALSREGDLLLAFGALGSGEGEFGGDSPRSLAVSPTGELFVLDANLDEAGRPFWRVLVFDARGEFQRSLALEPAPEPKALASNQDGTLYVLVDGGHIVELEPDEGRLIQRLGLDLLEGRLPQDLAVDAAGTLYLTTLIPANVAVLSPSGEFLAWLGEEGVRTGEGWPAGEYLFPAGIAVTADGRALFVGDVMWDFSYVTALALP